MKDSRPRNPIMPAGLRLALALCLAVMPVHTSRAATEGKPNILYILADDLGWGSVGCYGVDPNLVQTPNIDRLAKEGRRFTDAYVSASICTPSRYSMLTGRYCWRTELKFEVINQKDPMLIEPGRPTIASALQSQGYATAVIGKWHLGFGSTKPVDYTKDLSPGPRDIGFDYFYGLASNHGDSTGVYLDTEANERGEMVSRVHGLRSPNMTPFGKSAYGAPYVGLDAPQRVDENVMSDLTDKAISWMGRQQKAGKPFFLYFSPVAVHGPVTPSEATKGTSKAGPYGDWIHELDRSVGRLLEELDKRKLADNTLVVFTSDNGGEDRGFAKEERASIALGLKMNGDWRAGKHSVYEGGMRVPFLARWPGKVPSGTVSSEPFCLIDTFATLAALTGAPLPPKEQGAEDSFNMLPAFLGQTYSGPLRPALIGHSGWGVYSVRQGQWKWIEGKYAPAKEPKMNKIEFHPQLYNLAEDPGETRDVIAEHPEIAAKLAALLETWRQQGHSRQ